MCIGFGGLLLLEASQSLGCWFCGADLLAQVPYWAFSSFTLPPLPPLPAPVQLRLLCSWSPTCVVSQAFLPGWLVRSAFTLLPLR
jgi:hypothetical protein